MAEKSNSTIREGNKKLYNQWLLRSSKKPTNSTEKFQWILGGLALAFVVWGLLFLK